MHDKPIHIAVIVSTLDEEYQSGILQGVRQYAFANSVTLEHFVAFGNIGSDISHDIGEYNIFSLANLRRFDGIILVINTIQDAECLQTVVNRVRESGVPAVCIDKDVEGLYSIGIDNESAMYRMVEHFIVHHGFTRINYISGPDTNAESVLRLKAYRAALADHGILDEDERIYRGHFVSKDGTLAVQKFLASPLELPQAIVCANDNMAVAAVNALMIKGYSVPEDIAVSGFDYTKNAQNYAPSMTSVERPTAQVGMLACQKIMDHIDGKPQERVTTMETHCRFSQSCGCSAAPPMDTMEFKKHNYSVLESFSNDVSLASRLASALAECDSMEDYTAELRRFVPEFQCREFYLCLCDSWNQGILADETEENYLMHILSPDHFITEGYGDTIMVPLAYKDGQFLTVPDFPAEEMLPDLFDKNNPPGNYYFVPLHFRERTMGYIVIKDSDFPISSRLFHSCVMDIANSLESVRKIICLDRVTRKLNKLYTVDTLANINNRNGFRINTQNAYQYCIDAQKPVMLMFLDMDGLKTINDTYGHKAGDVAIASMAEVLRTACADGEVCCRFGGDEFIIFAADYTEERAEALGKHIRELLTKMNEERDFPYTLSTSLGYHITVPEAGMNLFQLVTIADNIMYTEKKKKKTSRYLKR
ncbi:MAG: GGDEF domain-containing protein [Oscillospiraceae bacterium]|nr:GGDEF domain-containing protein [Oscillospiraceae bacterium]